MSSDTQDVYVYLADKPIHRTVGCGMGGVNVDLAASGDVVGVECLGARSVTVDGQPVAAPSPAVDREALADLAGHHMRRGNTLCSCGQQFDGGFWANHLASALLARYDIRERGETA